MSDSGSNAKSEASTTLSEFVSRRYAGEVPVFGGDVRVGTRELTVAMTQSLRNSGLLDVLGTLSDTLRGIGSTHSTPTIGRSDNTAISPIKMDDGDIERKLDMAGELDNVKIRAMLESSMIASSDVDSFMALLSISRDSAKKKAIGMRVQAQRRDAALRPDRHVVSDEIMLWYQRTESSIADLEHNMFMWTGLVKPNVKFTEDVHRALVHESVFAGRCTNRKLALVGDAAMKLAFVEYGVRRLYSVGDVSSYLHASQSNLALRDVGLKAGLTKYVKAVPDIDVTSRNIMATVVEALYGAAYIAGGIDAVNRLNSSILMVFDPVSLDKKAENLGVPGLAISNSAVGSGLLDMTAE